MSSSYRCDFPMLQTEQPIIYFDNAATTLKPNSVVQAVNQFYTYHTANVSRSHHRHALMTTELFENVRSKSALFIGAKANEIIFTHNSTDALNLLAHVLQFSNTDEVVISRMDHNSAYLPFKMCANVKIFDVDPQGEIDLQKLSELFTSKTRLLVLNHTSNVTGNITKLESIIELAHQKNILVLVDASQSIAHIPLNVSQLKCDFLAFSAHKMCGPSGVGVLYINAQQLTALRPYRTGGGMVMKAGVDSISFQSTPHYFEAGTPNIEGILGFGKALDYFLSHDRSAMHSYLKSLDELFYQELSNRPFIKLLHGRAEQRAPIYTFTVENPNIDLNYVASILSDTYNIAVNTGTQCAHLFYEKAQINAGMRASLFLYNTVTEIIAFFAALDEISYMLNR